MKREWFRRIAVIGLLFWLPGSNQQATAQALREPTVDEQFRNTNDKGKSTRSVNADQPMLISPKTKVAAELLPAPDRSAAERLPPAYLGVTFDTQIREAIVRTVKPGSPAEQAGLKPKDVIETIQGRPVKSYQDVLDIVAKMRPGDMLNVEYSRRMAMRAQATLASLPAKTARSVGYPPDVPAGTSKTTTEHEQLPTPPETKGGTAATGSTQKRRTQNSN